MTLSSRRPFRLARQAEPPTPRSPVKRGRSRRRRQGLPSQDGSIGAVARPVVPGGASAQAQACRHSRLAHRAHVAPRPAVRRRSIVAPAVAGVDKAAARAVASSRAARGCARGTHIESRHARASTPLRPRHRDLEALGSVRLRARLGHGARGLQRRRRRLALLPARARPAARPTAGARTASPAICDRYQVLVFRPGPLERPRPDPEGAPVRRRALRGQSRRGRQGILLLPRHRRRPTRT